MRKIISAVMLMILIPALCLADVTVGKGKDYERFTEAVWRTEDDLIVYPGEYDIRQEYSEVFGDNVPVLFSVGIWLQNRKIVFMPGSELVCKWDRNDGFSVFYIGGNVILDGLNLYAEGMQYAIHDDLWHWTEPYINEYRHCRIIGRLLKGANCIGGGVAQNARIIIDSCYFDNGVNESITVRYHNTDITDARGDIWISDSYFNGYLGLCYYGVSSHLDVYVDGCRARKIDTMKETPDSWFANIDLYAWNNEKGEQHAD